MARVCLILLLVTIVAALAMRIAGPSDLYDNDQPDTVSYTADIVHHGRWFMPRNMVGMAPHKPPLYNWIAYPFQKAGLWSEWALKMPSILSGLVTIGLCVAMGRWLGLRTRGESAGSVRDRDEALAMGAVAGVLWIASHAGMKLIYLARPDMLLVACVNLSWAAATVLIVNPPSKRSWRMALQLALWLGVAGAALSKGPPALLPLIYIALGGKLLNGKWNAANRTGWMWGLPLALALSAVWIVGGWLSDPEAFYNELLVDQVAGRVTRGSAWLILLEFYKSPMLYIGRFLPWSLVGILTLIHIPPRRWFGNSMGPAILWLFLVIGFFMLGAGKRGDFLAPANIAGAILAAYWLVIVARKYRVRPVHVAAVGLAVAIGVGVYRLRFDAPAIEQYGNHSAAFARAVREVIGNEAIVFKRTGTNALQTRLGRQQAAWEPTDAQLRAAQWLVGRVSDLGPDAAVIISQPIAEVADPVEVEVGPDGRTEARSHPEPLGLYRLEAGQVVGANVPY